MEWGTFIPVIVALYLAWFGFNFLFDLFIGGKPRVQTEDGVQYNISDLMGEEESAQPVSESDYEPKPVAVYKTEAPTPPVAPDATDGPIAAEHELDTPAASNEPVPQMPGEDDDWDSPIHEDLEDKLNLPVQGQPIQIADFIQSLRDKAKLESASITF